MNDIHTEDDHLEADCLDPVLGGQVWRLDAPDCADELRGRLEHHLAYCAACRLQRAVEREVEAGLRGGDLLLAPAAPRLDRFAGLTAACGTLALAAGLAVLLVLPPAAPHDAMVLRGDDGPAIERPVPDEVVRGGRPTLRWTPLAKATRYDVKVTAVDGDHAWATSTREPVATVPPEAELPVGARYRVRVEPVPAHLAPDGALHTSFRTGGLGEWFGYRLGHGRAGGRWLGGAGLVGLLAGALGLLARRSAR
jgi:hypothetical protein